MYGKEVPTISSVSHSSMRLLRRAGAEQADAAGGVGAVVRHGRLAEQRLDDRRAEHLGELLQLVGGAERAAAGQDGDLLAGVQDLGGPRAGRPRRAGRRARAKHVGGVAGHVALRARLARPPAPGGRRGR